jgi:methyltransferase (TIGR00027 family)
MFGSVRAVTYQVADLQKAKDWYRQLLDREPAFDSPFAVVFAAGGCVLTLTPAGKADERTVAYWSVDDIDEAYRRLLDAGATARSEIITSVLGGRVVRVADPFGNVLGLAASPSDAGKKSLDDRPSDSAQTVAFCRALAARDERQEIRGPDYLAEMFLPADAKKLLTDPASSRWVRQKMQSSSPGGYEYFVARTAYIDSVVREAIRDGIPQIVFLGAGYDSRPYRFKDLLRSTRVFEMDSAPTQERKRRILEQANVAAPAGLAYVPVNFTRDNLENVLLKAGFDKGGRALFVWEGVTYYLPAAAIDRTMTAVRELAPSGGILCFDYMAAAPDMEDRYGVRLAREEMRARYVSEPVQFVIEEGAIETFLSERGYSLVNHLGAEEMERRFLTLADGSLAGRVLACFRLVQARCGRA